MALYDFRCTSCGRVFEKLVRREEVVHCPDCGASTADRLLAVPAPPARSSGARAPDCDAPGGCCGGGCAM